MRVKSTHLLFLLFFSVLSCNRPLAFSSEREEASRYFVKVFTHIQVTRCDKEKVPESEESCEDRWVTSTGSGLIIDLSEGHQNQIVLSAGHVCNSHMKDSEDEKYTYKISETIRILDRNSYIHDASVILSTMPPEGGDLCSLYVPTLQYLNPEGKSKIKLAYSAPRPGENVYYVGAPIGIHHPPAALMLHGIFSGDIDDISSLTSVPAAPGASGSVLLSLQNKIYGVVYAVHPLFNHATIVTSHEETKRFLIKTKEMIGDVSD
jgi:hypothetical protein